MGLTDSVYNMGQNVDYNKMKIKLLLTILLIFTFGLIYMAIPEKQLGFEEGESGFRNTMVHAISIHCFKFPYHRLSSIGLILSTTQLLLAFMIVIF